MTEAESYLSQLGANIDAPAGLSPSACVDEAPTAPFEAPGGAGVRVVGAAPEAGGLHSSHRKPEPLFNDQQPLYTIKHERPEHRIIVFLKAQGLSNKEIAERTGFTTMMVGYTLKQPWARERLLREIEQTGRDGVHELLKGSVEDSVLTLIEVQNDEKAKHSDRLAAANSILDRFFGKPTQRVESKNVNIRATAEEVSELEKQLAEVDRELQRVTGHPAAN